MSCIGLSHTGNYKLHVPGVHTGFLIWGGGGGGGGTQKFGIDVEGVL